jgi:hypothetical protein
MLNGPSASYRGHTPNYSAAVGNAGNLSMSRASCWMISVALKVATIPFSRSIEASVCERSELNRGTPLLS